MWLLSKGMNHLSNSKEIHNLKKIICICNTTARDVSKYRDFCSPILQLIKKLFSCNSIQCFGKRGRMEHRYQRVCLRAIERHSQGIYQVSKIGTGDKHLVGFQKKNYLWCYLWSVHIVNGVYGDQIMCSISYVIEFRPASLKSCTYTTTAWGATLSLPSHSSSTTWPWHYFFKVRSCATHLESGFVLCKLWPTECSILEYLSLDTMSLTPSAFV